jgi:Zinc finger, C3HC4 type (RING finger)
MAALANALEIDYEEWEDEQFIGSLSDSTNSVVTSGTNTSSSTKYSTCITNLLSKQCMDVKLSSEDIAHSLTAVSKKKLKDLITKHNNKLFSFAIHPEKRNIIHVAETIFRRFGQEAPVMKSKIDAMKDLNLDSSLDPVIAEFDEGLRAIRGVSLADFIKQMRWMFIQYKNIGEEVLRLETLLFQKVELLDKLDNRIQLITSLGTNDALPELVAAFTKYADKIYKSAQFEDTYRDLVEGYKKWNICRHIISMQNMMKNDTDPQCTICLLEPITHTIVPCGHTFCSTCAKKQNTTCYICRGQIRERVKLYFT